MVPLNTFRRHWSLHFFLLWPQVHTQIHTRMGLPQWEFWPSQDCSQAPHRALDRVLFLLGIKVSAFWWAKQLNWVNIQFVNKLVLACQLDHGCLPWINPVLYYFVPSKMKNPKISFSVPAMQGESWEFTEALARVWEVLVWGRAGNLYHFQTDKSCTLRATGCWMGKERVQLHCFYNMGMFSACACINCFPKYVENSTVGWPVLRSWGYLWNYTRINIARIKHTLLVCLPIHTDAYIYML